jgi:DNA-binding response OmpR family regulator
MRDGKHVILYIDDDPDILGAMRIQLEALGYIMVEAQDGAQGLRAFRKERPDIVLVDLMMEEVDAGTRFVRHLRLEAPTVPVVMITSVGDSFNLTADAADLGLSAILQKPIHVKTLAKILEARISK